MRSVARLRPNPPSRAKRNVRWAAIALIALSLAPASSPDPAAAGKDDDPALAAEMDPAAVEETPWLADGGVLDSMIE
jgi:hypothetical protein